MITPPGSELHLARLTHTTFLSPVFTDFGVEKKASLEGLDEKAVQAAVTDMLK